MTQSPGPAGALVCRVRSAGDGSPHGHRSAAREHSLELAAVLVVRRHASRYPVGAVLFDRQRPARPAAVAIAVEVAQDRVVAVTPARRWARKHVLDETDHLKLASDVAPMARSRAGAGELATTDHDGRAEQAALATCDPG